MENMKVGSHLPENKVTEHAKGLGLQHDFESCFQRFVDDFKEEVVEPLKEELEKARGPEPLWSLKEVARRMGISIRKAEELVASGELTPIRFPGSNIRRFEPKVVESFIRSCTRRKSSRRAGK